MKKSLLLIISLIIIFIVVGFIIYNHRTISTITLDINPSIKINLDKNELVKSIVALNDDAKDIISNNIKGKSLANTFEILITNLLEKGYVSEENNIDVILHVDGKISNEDIAKRIEFEFGKKDVHSEIIIINEITTIDKELAKKYHITPAKASYIKTIVNENISIDALVDKSVSELNETKTTGKYCDQGYTLEGDWCLKEVGRNSAVNGEVCPGGYLEYHGKCYEEVPIRYTDKLYCREEFQLVDDKCIRTVSMNAEPVKYYCPSGEETTRYKAGLTEESAGDANDIVCVDTSNAVHPVSPCETHDGTEYTISGGKCYWHRAPVIESGCPGKSLVNGMCWDDASNVLICEGYRDGKRYHSRSDYCEHSIKYIEPVVSEYQCPSDYTLNGSKCLKDEIEDAQYEQICPSGYSLVNHDRCINYNQSVSKETGFVCNHENARLEGNTCIIYEMIEAKDY